MISEL
jgi:hypothetical protein